MEMIELARFPIDEDLTLLKRALVQNRIAHRIFEQGVEQILAIDVSAATLGHHLLTLYKGGSLLVGEPSSKTSLSRFRASQFSLVKVPVTSLLIGLSVLGFLVVQLKLWPIVFALLYQPTSIVAGSISFGDVSEALAVGQVWRLVSPIFLHFGVMHVVFNSLWCWELGRRIETVESSNHLIMLVVVSALISNATQYQLGGPAFFGGLSGVVYAFLGYCGVTQWLVPSSSLAISPSIYIIMLAFLVLGMTGIFDVLGGGAVANAAHVGGLLAGAVWALLVRRILD